MPLKKHVTTGCKRDRRFVAIVLSRMGRIQTGYGFRIQVSSGFFLKYSPGGQVFFPFEGGPVADLFHGGPGFWATAV